MSIDLLEWQLHSSVVSENFIENFKKLVEHLKTIFGCSVIKLVPQFLEVTLAFGYNRQQLKIQYDADQKYFSIYIKDINTNQILLDTSCYGGWDVVLTNLLKHGYIKDKKLCESISTIDEIRIYKNLWN